MLPYDKRKPLKDETATGAERPAGCGLSESKGEGHSHPLDGHCEPTRSVTDPSREGYVSVNRDGPEFTLSLDTILDRVVRIGARSQRSRGR